MQHTPVDWPNGGQERVQRNHNKPVGSRVVIVIEKGQEQKRLGVDRDVGSQQKLADRSGPQLNKNPDSLISCVSLILKAELKTFHLPSHLTN